MTTPILFRLRSLRFLSLFALGLLPTALILAADAPKQAFDLPADTAENSIKRFSEQTNLEVLYASDVTQGVRTEAVKGEMTPREALDAMLAGTGLTVVQDEQTKAFSVRRENAGPNVPGAALPETSGRPVQKTGNASDQTVRLDPFEVQTSKDTSYGALNSNSITRFNTELDKVPISADIFTQTFMDDVGATSVNGMLAGYGAGMGMVLSNASADALQNQPGDRVVIGDRFTPQQIGVRGLSAGNIRRDGFTNFPTNTSSTSNFDIERVEVLRGPQGLLYGAGGAGGTIVATTNRAMFDQDGGRVSERIDQYGSKQALVDVNDGNDWVAARFSFVDSDNDVRRVNIGDSLQGYYGQLAFRLPMNTTLRVEGEYTYDYKNLSTSTTTVNLGGTTKDPRSGDQLSYLLLTNQAGAINPATGQPFPGGAIDNGNLNWGNYASFAGDREQDIVQNYTLEAIADTTWTKWLATTIGVNLNRSDDRSDNNLTQLNAPMQNSNPFNNWAVGSNMQDVLNQQLYKEFRVSALITKDFFGGRVKTQSAGGYDTSWRGYGAIDWGYFLADSSGNIMVNPASNSNLGRTAIGTQYWVVDNGPVEYPTVPRGTPVFVSPLNGMTYARAVLNPRSPAYINPGNPLGDASLNDPTQTGTVATPGVAGINQGGYGEQVNVRAYYLSNYTSWFNDWVTTLIGYRMTNTHTHIPNGSSNIYGPGKDYVSPANFSDPSYNLGLDGRITNWLRWYADLSSTYNDGVGQDDPIGNAPPTTYAHGWEAGLKFTPMNSLISGSFDYYRTSDHNDNVNYGGNIINAINPQGIAGTYTGPAGRNSFVALDEKSSGLELILTAAPTPNWRIRLSATQSNGTILTTKRYGITYNDQFNTDGKGNVTYADGQPFIVPVTPGTNVSTLSAATSPATLATILASGPTEQLTTAMMGDPNSVYYAWGKGNPQNANGQINSGLAGTSTSDVGNVLRFFKDASGALATTGVTGLPISDIQYAWTPPANEPNGSVLVANTGDPTVGYPVFELRLLSTYEFNSGPLKGFGTAIGLSNSWQNRTYIYLNPDGSRPMFSAPELGWQIELHPYYRRKFGRILWRTQIDILNLTNHYLLTLAPNNGTGFATPANIGVLWTGQPRSIAWSNTFSF